MDTTGYKSRLKLKINQKDRKWKKKIIDYCWFDLKSVEIRAEKNMSPGHPKMVMEVTRIGSVMKINYETCHPVDTTTTKEELYRNGSG